MPKHPGRDNLPGNDGRWYLELVGVVEPPPEATDTYATLEHLEPPPTPDDTATTSTAAAAAAVAGDLVSGTTQNGEYVPLGPGSAVPEEDNDRRGHGRWWALGAVALLGVLAATAAGYLLPRAADAEAAVLAGEYRTALVELRNELPNTQPALGNLTDPGASKEAMSAVPIAIADLSASSGRTVATATTPLPGTLPLVPRSSYEALQPTRSRMTILGAAGQDLAGRLGVGFTYRTTVESLFAVEPLPTAAFDTAISELSIALAADLAETGRLVAELDQDADFISVREAAIAASQRYAIWQLEYLEALRAGDPERAVVLVAELDATIVAINVELDNALAIMRTDVDSVIVELATELEAAIDGVPS